MGYSLFMTWNKGSIDNAGNSFMGVSRLTDAYEINYTLYINKSVFTTIKAIHEQLSGSYEVSHLMVIALTLLSQI